VDPLPAQPDFPGSPGHLAPELPGQRGGHDRIGVVTAHRDRFGGRYHFWYEGCGGGAARTEAYGSCLQGGRSQAGLATMEAPYFYVRPPAGSAPAAYT
jgi:hypothetical protein